jgi:periplasmic copper chaperone A
MRGALCLVGLAAWALCVLAAEPAGLSVHNAWITQAPGADVAAAYLTLHNASARSVTVLEIHSPIARTIVIHQSQIEGGMSKMRPASPLRVLPGQTVKLEPGGLHAMLEGVAQPLKIGDIVPLVLKLDDGSSVQVRAQVRPLGAQ